VGVKDKVPPWSRAGVGDERVKCPLCKAAVSHRVSVEHNGSDPQHMQLWINNETNLGYLV